MLRLCVQARQGVKGFMSFLLNSGSTLQRHGSPTNCEFNMVYTMIAMSCQHAHSCCRSANKHSSIKNIKVVASHPQNSLAGESLGGLGHCRLLILLNWLDIKVSTLLHEDVQDWVISFHLFTLLNTYKHTLIQTVEADGDALTPWLFSFPTATVYQPLIQEDQTEHWHVSIASVLWNLE